MAEIWVDGRSYRVEGSENLLHACLSLGLDLPYFCWHPALGSVGACRQCAVKQFKDENDSRGKLVMACMTPAADGCRISIADREAHDFRASVIEWLMTNHPHDCPVCDEGGECHLQDMTVATGHDYRRYRFRKRTHLNQYLGPFINHEMNRCIACYRCVRYYRDYAGGRDLDVFAAHHQVYFGRHQDGVLESEFSGNLVEVCPTGVFTDKTLKEHYTRKWDLEAAPSVCVHCAVGCNTIAGERYGTLRRILNRYHHEVNGYFLCDRGRFGYGFVTDAGRVWEPLVAGADGLAPAAEEAALAPLAELLAAGKRVLGIGSPRASLEANFALRQLVGAERFHLGAVEGERQRTELALEVLQSGPVPVASLEDVRRSDAVLLLGEDPTDTAPVLALALRQAARRKPLERADAAGIPSWNDAAVRELLQSEAGPFYVASALPTRLDELATRTYRASPAEQARLASAVARQLDPAAPEVPGLTAELATLAAEVAAALRDAERPLVVAGEGAASRELLAAAADVAAALWKARPERTGNERSQLCWTLAECNSAGLALLGGQPLAAAFAAAARGEVDAAVVLENDLYRRAPETAVDAFLEAVPTVVVLDHLRHATAERAAAVLPAAAFPEGDGTLVSSEGRAQRSFQVYMPEGPIRESWRWLADLAAAAGREAELPWRSLDEVAGALAAAHPVFAPLPEVAPSAAFRAAGRRVAREPHRYSGRTAMRAQVSVHEPKPPEDPDSALSYSMEGSTAMPPPALLPFYWSPGWNSVQSLNKFQQEVGGPLRGGDPGVRLLSPPADAPVTYRAEPAGPETRRDGEWLIVPRPLIFGSEELSARAPAVAERVPAPHLALGTEDAEALGVAAGATVELELDGRRLELAVELLPGVPPGVAALPVGLPGMEAMELPGRGRIVAR